MIQSSSAATSCMCSGYYNYDRGYTPEFEGTECFNGPIIHPQHWPEDLDYQGKRVVVIGSGATAVTLVPALAKPRPCHHAAALPTYVVSRPAEDRFANKLREILPPALAYFITRWRNILFQRFIYERCRKYPRQAKARIIAMVRDELGPQYDVDTHFTPTYPWDQRLCLVLTAICSRPYARAAHRWLPTISIASPATACG